MANRRTNNVPGDPPTRSNPMPVVAFGVDQIRVPATLRVLSHQERRPMPHRPEPREYLLSMCLPRAIPVPGPWRKDPPRRQPQTNCVAYRLRQQVRRAHRRPPWPQRRFSATTEPLHPTRVAQPRARMRSEPVPAPDLRRRPADTLASFGRADYWAGRYRLHPLPMPVRRQTEWNRPQACRRKV